MLAVSLDHARQVEFQQDKADRSRLEPGRSADLVDVAGMGSKGIEHALAFSGRWLRSVRGGWQRRHLGRHGLP